MKHKIITYWTAALLLIAQLTPLSVYAQGVPTFDVGLNSYGQGGVMGTVKEYGLDTLAYTLSKLAGAKIANKVFNKANGGASGDSAQPSYIKNFNSYFSDLSNLQVDRYIEIQQILRVKNPRENYFHEMLFLMKRKI